MIRSLVSLSLLLLAGCTFASARASRLPHFDLCADAHASVTRTVDLDALPADAPTLVPYALVVGIGTKDVDAVRWTMCRWIDAMHAPDVLAFRNGTGLDAEITAMNGIFPPYEWRAASRSGGRKVYAYALRLAPCRLEIGTDADRRVVWVGPSAADAGVKIGDVLLSVEGEAFQHGDRWSTSPHYRVLLTRQPSDDVTVAWMTHDGETKQASIQLQPNPSASLHALPAAPDVPQIERALP